MNRFVKLFFFFIIIFQFGMYWVFDAVLTAGESPMFIMLRVEQGGKAFEGSLSVYDGSGERTGFSDNRSLACFFYRLSDEVTTLEIRDTGDRVVFTFPKSRLVPNANILIDLDNGDITGKVSFGQYFMGIFYSVGWVWLAFLLLASVPAYIVFLVPLSFLAMIYTIIRELIAGQKRGFAGKYGAMVFGFLVIGFVFYGYYYQWGEAWYLIEKIQTDMPALLPFFWVFIVGGYGLYFFAYRSFEAKEIRAKRKAFRQKEIEDAINVKTYTEYTWSDGTTTDDLLDKQLGNLWAVRFGHFLAAVFLPFSTISGMIRFYLVPLMNGEPSWVLYERWLKEQEETVDDVRAYVRLPEEDEVIDDIVPLSSNRPTESVNSCKACGAELSGIGKFCARCGTPV